MADATTVATQAAAAVTDDATTNVDDSAAGAAGDGATADDGAAGGGTTTTTAKQPSEVVRLVRENKRLKAEADAAKAGGAGGKPVTHDTVVAELRESYKADPVAFLKDIAGEGLYDLAARIAKQPPSESDKLAEMQARIDELEGRVKPLDERVRNETAAQKQARTDAHVANIAKEIDAVDAETGEPVYPVLSTLDLSALDRPPALDAYDAVMHAWQIECCESDKDGNVTKVVKKWSDDEKVKRFKAAFGALEAHYAKLRSPRPKNPSAQNPDSETSPTIDNTRSPGPTRRATETRAPGTMDWRAALAKNLREAGQ